MIKFITIFFMLILSADVFSARLSGGGTHQVNLYTHADMCIDCNQAKADAFVLSLIPGYSVNNSEYYIYIVDPVRDTKTRYEIEALGNQKFITNRKQMTTYEERIFEPLMSYARNVVDLQRTIAQKIPDTILNSELCDSSLDAYSNKSCGKAVMDDLRNEATIRNIFNADLNSYTITVGANAKILNGSISLQGQGNNGILRVVYTFTDGSIAVYKVKDGEIVELDTEFSKSATGETLKKIIAELNAEKFGQRGIEGHELADHVDLWAGHARKFCDLLPSYKLVQMEVLECRSKVTSAGLKIECRILGKTNVPTVAYSCR